MGILASSEIFAQVPAALKIFPNLESNIDRPLRYRPEGADFVIENGAEFFNRPLYGGNTAFRVDGGDQPEFVLYLPGRGGNLRLGVHSAAGTKWLQSAAKIEMRYRPGELLYAIRDPLFGEAGVLNVKVVAYHQTEGLAVRVEARECGPNGGQGERMLRPSTTGFTCVSELSVLHCAPVHPHFQRIRAVAQHPGIKRRHSRAGAAAE